MGNGRWGFAYLAFRGRCLRTPHRRQAEARIEPSVGGKDDSYDKALAETINGLYQAALIHRQS
jgi:hypothetical protein